MKYLANEGYYVFSPLGSQSPIDVVAVDKSGRSFFFDAKKDARRVNPGRKNKDRIHRPRSDLQKQMGVRMAYVDLETGNVHIVPSLQD
jgi:hypothetical protein